MERELLSESTYASCSIQNKIIGKEKYMKFAKNKTMAIAIAMFLMLSMSASTMLLPTANAHTPKWTIHSYAYITVGPNPVGVGQRVLILMWVDGPLNGATLDNDIRRHDYTLVITDPDGQKETMNWPTISDPTSCQFVGYTPTKVGTYTLNFSYPEQTYHTLGAATSRMIPSQQPPHQQP
jgi:hypothetical protein